MKKNSLEIYVEETNINFYQWQIIIEGFFRSKRLHKYLPRRYNVQFALIENDHGRSGIDVDGWVEMSEWLFDRLAERSVPLKTLTTEHKLAGEKIWQIYELVINARLKDISNQTIIQWFQIMWREFMELNGIGLIPVASDFYHSLLTNKLTEILKGKKLEGERLQSALTLLMSPDLPSTAWREHLELLQIIKTHSGFAKIIKSADFERHLEKYKWLNYGYQGPQISRADYVSRIEKILKNKISATKQLVEHKQHFQKLIRQQERLEKKLKLNKTEKYSFSLARLFTYLKGYRVDVRHYFSYASDSLFRELGRRYRLPITWFRYAQRLEIIRLLRGKRVSKKKILERRKKMLWIIEKRRGARFIPPAKINRFYEDYVVQEEVRATEILTGMPAFLGEVRGEAKIVNSVKDIPKVKHGDVLVAITTNPDLLPAMYRAAAFVTDSGGITSHAAIVARELKKPCVIGTKIGTKILKDGDFVEVDANKGIVRRLDD